MHHDRRPILMAWIPAIILGGFYFALLGYRRDYLGHYAAGYGATLAGLCAVQAAIIPQRYTQLAPLIALPGTILCIAMGTVAEATVFRLARFDEIDLCNQSLGAVLAGIVSWQLGRATKPSDATFLACMTSGFVMLVLGTYFALT